MTSTPEQSARLQAMTPRQREILVLVINGLTNREIAQWLGLTPGLVGAYIGRLSRCSV